MRKSLLFTIICLISVMLLAGCGGNKEAATPSDAPEPAQEAAEDQAAPTAPPAPETSKPEETEEAEPEPETNDEEAAPVDNYYVHRFDSFDDLLYAYKETQDRYYSQEQVELIFGWGEKLIDHGWPVEVSPYDVGYIYYDVDSDGTDEMIITLGKDIVEIYSYFTGKLQRFYSAPYGCEITLYPGGILKQYAPDTSEFSGTSWYSYDAGLAGYYKDFEECGGEYYTFCHHDFSGPEYDEIAARLQEDPDADMPVWIGEYEDMLSEAEYKKLLPKTKPVQLPDAAKLADIELPDGYKPRYEANEGPKDEVIPEYFEYVTSRDGYANMRKGPGTEYDVICQVPTGGQLEVYRIKAVDSKGKTWVRAVYWHSSDDTQADGTDDIGVTETGWIAESQLDQ